MILRLMPPVHNFGQVRRRFHQELWEKANSSLKAQIRFEPSKSTMNSSDFFDPESGLFEAELRWGFELMPSSRLLIG